MYRIIYLKERNIHTYHTQHSQYVAAEAAARMMAMSGIRGVTWVGVQNVKTGYVVRTWDATARDQREA